RLFVPFELEPPLAHVETIDDFIPLEGMEEMAAVRPPVDKLDRQLVGGVAGWHPLALLEPEEVEVELDGAEGRLSDADRLDVGRLDEGDVEPGERLLQMRRGHPAGRSPADDYDAFCHGRNVPLER